MTRFGIVGTGMISEFHAQAIAVIDGAEIAACFDISAERAGDFATRWNCAAYSELKEFLNHRDMETVIICTPSGLHLEPGLAALEAGFHLVVEKPLEITAERCDRLIERADQKGLKIAGIFPMRFGDGAQMVKTAVDAGRFGTLSLATTSVKWFRTQEYYDQAGWRGTWDVDGGGALMNQSIHAIDLLQWLVGDVAEVFAYADTLAHTGIEVEDVAASALRFAGGALGTIVGTTASWPGWAKRVEISGSTGSVALEDEKVTKWEFEVEADGDTTVRGGAGIGEGKAKGAADPKSISFEGHRLQLVDFIRALETGKQPLVDGREARKAVAIIEAIYRSAKSGKPETVL